MNLNDLHHKLTDLAISNGIMINLFRLMSSKNINNDPIKKKLRDFKKDFESKLKMQKLSIIVFVASYNEEALIETCLRSIKESVNRSIWCNQTKIMLLDSHSTDQTTQIASKYVDKIIDCPKGKLNARHYGYLNEQCDLIVCADADRQYKITWFDSLVE